MPFGLTNTAAVFQGLFNDVLWDMINQFVFVYLDDILIFSTSPEEHTTHIRKVLQCLLYVKAEKCSSCSSTAFLGYIISTGSISMDPEKVRPVEEWSKPTDRKAWQRFLGFAIFYRRFIRNYSTIAAPLTHLTSTMVCFCWDQYAESSFIELKRRFPSGPILVHPDPEAQFIVEVDASNVGVGAILFQSLAGDSSTRNILVPSIHTICPQPSRITTLGTRSYCRSNSH